MIATTWEFKNRALVFGLIFGIAFATYGIDHQTSAAAFANWVAPRLHLDANRIAELLFWLAALFVALAAFFRTWGSSYLSAGVVYASQVKTEALVADGPYRYVRNPLYFANVLLALGLGALMSRLGFFLAVALMVLFCYRLILREEAELSGSQGHHYESYANAVPRLLFFPWPRVPSSGRRADWADGFKAEGWYWGIAAALVAFAATLNFKLFLGILTASLALFWISATLLEKKSRSQL
ncbi:MAG TPA: methyltransferase [Candidatus Acidoferrales bacterium]|jgi:protein-S-isoprenylcysteine O-methyltransferase Ste14|nr:methyltransferase [Candidatus Acidoferrales bacterium]